MPEPVIQEIIEKLDIGWVLQGDTSKEAPFGFIDPTYKEGPMTSFPTVPADIVRHLHENGYLRPEPLPGRVIAYRRSD